jgi:hypothetical protein
MINLNFNLKDIDWSKLKNISTTNVFLSFCLIGMIFLFFKEEIKEKYLKKDTIVKKDSKKTEKDSSKVVIKPDRFGRKLIKLEEFQYRLDELRSHYKCDRVNINLFHNGDSTKAGWHFDKMSCEMESKLDTLPSYTTRLVNWRIEPFKKKFRQLLFEEIVYIADLKKDIDPYFRNTLPRYGAFSVVYVALFDKRMYDPITKKNHLMGFLAFQWGKPTNLSNSKIQSMKNERHNLYQYIIRK